MPPADQPEVREFKKRIPHIRRRLLKWFDDNQRDYPWRTTRNWFHLIMAEMMLRRTKADQVKPVYLEFERRFETPADAASLEESELEELFYSLGLRWRTRQLRQTITYLSDRFEKRGPLPSDDLREIPGVGEYSEAMVRNRLFGEPVAAIDSNVARLICRTVGMDYNPESRRNQTIVELANRLIASNRAAELNLAFLDLSALVCKPRNPACPCCPLNRLCATGIEQTQN